MTHVTDNLNYLSTNRQIPVTAAVAVQVAVTLSKWAQRRRTRKALAQLTPSLLEDVGLTPAEASHEARRAFWRA